MSENTLIRECLIIVCTTVLLIVFIRAILQSRLKNKEYSYLLRNEFVKNRIITLNNKRKENFNFNEYINKINEKMDEVQKETEKKNDDFAKIIFKLDGIISSSNKKNEPNVPA